jgi:hypothetical protein
VEEEETDPVEEVRFRVTIGDKKCWIRTEEGMNQRNLEKVLERRIRLGNIRVKVPGGRVPRQWEGRTVQARHRIRGGMMQDDAPEPEQRDIEGEEEESQWESEAETASIMEEIEYALRELLLANAVRKGTVEIMQKHRTAMGALEEERVQQCEPLDDPTMWTQQVEKSTE